MKSMAVNLEKKLIVVLGMHRSGTSAVTRALQVMGVKLGDNLMEPMETVNAKGFWEDLDLNDLNIEMLTAVGLDWDFLSPVKAEMVDKLIEKGYLLRATKMLAEKVSMHGVFGFKDPRVTKLLPFWLRVFAECDFSTQFVLAVRNPMSVAKSLLSRDGFCAEKSYSLWLESVILSLSVVEDFGLELIDFDCLMGSPASEVSRVSVALGLDVEQSELMEYTSSFLDHGLRHAVYSIEQLEQDSGCPLVVKEVYSYLHNCAFGRQSLVSQEMKSLYSRWRGELDQLSLFFSIHDNAVAQAHDLQCAIENNATEQILYRDELVCQLEVRLEEVKRNSDEQIEYRDELVQQLQDQLADTNRNADAQISYRDELVSQLQEQLVDTERNGEERIKCRDEFVLQLEEQLGDAIQKIKSLNVIIDDMEDDMSRMIRNPLLTFKRKFWPK